LKTLKKAALFALSLLALGVTLAGCASAPAASNSQGTGPLGMDLDAAVKEAAAQMEARLPAKTMVALVSVMSPSTAFSEQAITRLESAIVSSGKLVVVDRANLDKIRAEQGFQLSDEVDDNSAKSIGKLLGAGDIVTGSLTDLGDVYSLTLKAINIETATVAVSYLADLAKTTRIEILLASGGGAGGSVSSVSAQTVVPATASQTLAQATPAQAVAPAAPQSPVYRVGDTGPAGGLIFYDKGNDSGGWRYMEAAPMDMDEKVLWETRDLPDGSINESAVGKGKSNTQAIVAIMNSRGGGFNMAAWICDELSINGFDDWFLPSQDELHWMYGNLHRRNLGDFKHDWYWSSTKVRNWGQACAENFSDGNQQNSQVNISKFFVRAIRQF
jgi:hypothetical protein